MSYNYVVVNLRCVVFLYESCLPPLQSIDQKLWIFNHTFQSLGILNKMIKSHVPLFIDFLKYKMVFLHSRKSRTLKWSNPLRSVIREDRSGWIDHLQISLEWFYLPLSSPFLSINVGGEFDLVWFKTLMRCSIFLELSDLCVHDKRMMTYCSGRTLCIEHGITIFKNEHLVL